mmetsp:Transcript_5637/g.8902  ORF Transcript_5637/g.8902 Transcript_5637/m.8902 type:complete len:184 (-) Transcript_5637:25-576(-)
MTFEDIDKLNHKHFRGGGFEPKDILDLNDNDQDDEILMKFNRPVASKKKTTTQSVEPRSPYSKGVRHSKQASSKLIRNDSLPGIQQMKIEETYPGSSLLAPSSHYKRTSPYRSVKNLQPLESEPYITQARMAQNHSVMKDSSIKVNKRRRQVVLPPIEGGQQPRSTGLVEVRSHKMLRRPPLY